MKIFIVFCVLVVGVASYSDTINTGRYKPGYGPQRNPIIPRAIQRRPTAYPYKAPLTKYTPVPPTAYPYKAPVSKYTPVPNVPFRPESLYGQQRKQQLENPFAIRSPGVEIPITRFDHVINPDSGYSIDFESGNGIRSQETGFLKNVPASIGEGGSYEYGFGGTRLGESVKAVLAKTGESSWCSPEGYRFTLAYTADETGYHPKLTKTFCENGYYSKDYYNSLPQAFSPYRQTPFIPRKSFFDNKN